MAFYAWTATDAAGKTQRGTLQAEGQKQVRQWLREQKLIPVSITETREAAAGGKAKTGAKLSTPVLSMFTRQLSTLVNAALSPVTLIFTVPSGHALTSVDGIAARQVPSASTVAA